MAFIYRTVINNPYSTCMLGYLYDLGYLGVAWSHAQKQKSIILAYYRRTFQGFL
jgi:hypothetical protein